MGDDTTTAILTVAATVAFGPAGGLAVLGTSEAIKGQKQAASQAKKARRAQQRINELKEQRTRRQTIREAIIKQGQLENVAAQTGQAGSSAASQAEGSISSQLGSNLSFLSQTGSLTQEISRRTQKQADATFRAGRAQQIGDLGFQALGAGGGGGSTTGSAVSGPQPIGLPRGSGSDFRNIA